MSHTLSIPIADITCNLVFNEKKNFTYFKKRLQFLPQIVPKPTLELSITETNNEVCILNHRQKKLCTIKKDQYFLWEEFFFVLQAIIQSQVLPYDILFLHASSIVKNNCAYVFIAPSGSGKSTIISFFPKKSVLSDDVAIIKKVDSRFEVFSSIFDNKGFFSFPLKKANLDKIFSIKKASFISYVSTDSLEGLEVILNNNILFWLLQTGNKKSFNAKQSQANLYQLCFELLSTIKFETLYFRNDDTFLSSLKR